MSTQVPENMKDILDEITSYVYLTNFMLPDRSNLGDHKLFGHDESGGQGA